MALKNIPERKEIENKYKWDLTSFIPDDDEWEKIYKKIESEINGYENFKGRMGESLEVFRSSLEFDMNMSREIEKIYTYAHLRSDEDKTNQFTLAMYQRSVNLYTRISEMSSFMTPEIQEIDDTVINSYINDASMKDYRFFLEKTRLLLVEMGCQLLCRKSNCFRPGCRKCLFLQEPSNSQRQTPLD